MTKVLDNRNILIAYWTMHWSKNVFVLKTYIEEDFNDTE